MSRSSVRKMVESCLLSMIWPLQLLNIDTEYTSSTIPAAYYSCMLCIHSYGVHDACVLHAHTHCSYYSAEEYKFSLIGHGTYYIYLRIVQAGVTWIRSLMDITTIESWAICQSKVSTELHEVFKSYTRNWLTIPLSLDPSNINNTQSLHAWNLINLLSIALILPPIQLTINGITCMHACHMPMY